MSTPSPHTINQSWSHLVYLCSSQDYIKLLSLFQCASYTFACCANMLFTPTFPWIIRSEICNIACILTAIVQPERLTLLLAPFSVPLLMFFCHSPCQQLPNANAIEGRTPARVSTWAWLPFSVSMVSVNNLLKLIYELLLIGSYYFTYIDPVGTLLVSWYYM